jgi:hypothetical protein
VDEYDDNECFQQGQLTHNKDQTGSSYLYSFGLCMIFINHLMMTGEVFNKFVICFVADEEILTGAEANQNSFECTVVDGGKRYMSALFLCEFDRN